ncbi:MAG: glutamine synthetase family protein [Planktomarina sp.]
MTQNFLDQNPDIRAVHTVTADLNGQARGKRLPRRFSGGLYSGETRFPYSALNLDIFGEDIEDSPLVFETGDADGLLRPTERGFIPAPWLETPTALLPMWMYHPDGNPYLGDPRHALAAVLDRYTALGFTPVVATELEFYLIDDSGGHIQPPKSPKSGKRSTGSEILSQRPLDEFDVFFTEVYDACQIMDIPANAAISEAGPGQFEIDLSHQPDALKAADDAFFFKQLVSGLARKYGFGATFMAKPYSESSGNGLHTHFSVLDKDGNNIFSDGGSAGSDALRHAVAGCLSMMQSSTIIFAPHANSFARLVPDAHAPTGVAWAYDNRTAAVRVPSGSPVSRRIEHRVAGGDCNPYLLLTVVLGAALDGMERQATSPDPITGSAYSLNLDQIPNTWETALELFANDPQMGRILPNQLIENLVMTKRQEIRRISELPTDEQTKVYLNTL